MNSCIYTTVFDLTNGFTAHANINHRLSRPYYIYSLLSLSNEKVNEHFLIHKM